MDLETVINVYINAYYFRNGYGLSGGDKRAIEVLRRWLSRKAVAPGKEALTGKEVHQGKEALLGKEVHQGKEALRGIEVLRGKEKIRVIAPGKMFTILEKEGIEGFEPVVTSVGNSEDRSIFSAYRIHLKNAIADMKDVCRKRKGNGEGCLFYTTSDYFTDILPAAYGKKHLAGSRWYAIIHHIIEDYHTRPGSRLHNWLAYREQQWCIRRIVRDADRILTVSPLVYDYLQNEWNVPESRLVLVSNGIDVGTIERQEPYQEKERQFDGVFLARFAKSKGILEFPAIWEEVVKAVPGARLCLVGDGTEEVVHSLQDDFAARGIGDLVTIPGFLPGNEVYRQLKSAKVFLLPSHEEGWGIVIAEAMGCGLPVVTYDLPVFPRIFHGINLSGPVGDTKAFADNVISLLQNEEKREAIGKAGKELVDSRYTWDKVAEQDWEILHES